ncbi:ethanolamine ammonia-lyase reactivating factor EutA [Brevibacillus ginsengisoli]|uniref:ethanolamine ammonia-lyase reactivating factor EutA n=1 Tax=Brevibacillus ginsengisoli TaxID=363854 RepID=UPI003CF68EC6
MRETLLSVGIDIGTSTTQLVLSKLYIENMASSFTVPRLVISDKEVVYESEIIFTPVLDDNRIDTAAIRAFVEREYKKGGVDKQDIQTGAVIITGETARKENANDVLLNLSGYAGDFVVATAGPDLESIIAAKGAGAHAYAKEHATSVVNLDIGGGTTNLAVFCNDELIDTGCLDIGGRLIKVDKATGKITYIADKIKRLIERKGLSIQLGQTATPELLMPVIDEMVKLLEESVGLRAQSDFYETILTNKGLKLERPITCVSFSGGVADYIYAGETDDVFRFGDIGVLLGRSIQKSAMTRDLKLITAAETIRATVVGAGSHTTEISGSTITYTNEIFPLKNIPILKLAKQDEELDSASLGRVIAEKLEWFRVDGELPNVVVAFTGLKNPKFTDVERYADGLLMGMKALIEKASPLVVVVENDMAKVLGQTMYARLQYKKDVVCIDSISVDNGDYIDIGKPVANGTVLPVVIKTLIFNQ